MTSRKRLLSLAGVGLIVLALLLGLYILVAYVAWQSGSTLRVERIEEERATQLAEQMTRAHNDLDSENYRLARRRLEWVLENDPGNSEAQSLLNEALQALEGNQASPTPIITQPAATATTVPTTTRAVQQDEQEAARTLRRAEELVEDEEWAEAISTLVTFQNDFPGYERRQTDTLLYEAYTGQGVELLYTERVELGLYYLEQAERLGDLPTAAQDQKQWAELYLAGMGYYGVNWDVTAFYFRDLCLAAPFFQDSCAKLYTALVSFGDQYAFIQEWCPAESLYAEAYRLERGTGLADKLGQAREGCLQATPTPSAPITGTLPLTNTDPITGSRPLILP